MKRVLFAVTFLACFMFVGCEMNDGSGGQTTKTMLYGELHPPIVTPAIIGQSKRASVKTSYIDNELLYKFVASGSCLVNNKPTAFKLNTATSRFEINDLDPADVYEVRFNLGSLSLRATKPYYNTQMNMGEVNLTSTAKSLLYEAYVAKNSEIKKYDICEEYYRPLATQLETWLKTNDMSSETFKSNLENSLDAIKREHPSLSEISTYVGNDMSGTWKGQGVLYTLTSGGSVGHEANVAVTLTAKRDKNVLSGYIDVAILSDSVKNNGGGIPLKGKRDFANVVVQTEGTFSFKAYDVNGNLAEVWNFKLDSSDALVCSVKTASLSGFQSGVPIALRQK